MHPESPLWMIEIPWLCPFRSAIASVLAQPTQMSVKKTRSDELPSWELDRSRYFSVMPSEFLTRMSSSSFASSKHAILSRVFRPCDTAGSHPPRRHQVIRNQGIRSIPDSARVGRCVPRHPELRGCLPPPPPACPGWDVVDRHQSSQLDFVTQACCFDGFVSSGIAARPFVVASSCDIGISVKERDLSPVRYPNVSVKALRRHANDYEKRIQRASVAGLNVVLIENSLMLLEQ